MKCERCPYQLACWSDYFHKFLCRKCKRMILDTSDSIMLDESVEIVIMKNCRGVQRETAQLQDIPEDHGEYAYNTCPMCVTGWRSNWLSFHRWFKEPFAWRFVRKLPPTKAIR